MRIEILISRKRLPLPGTIVEYEETYAQQLIDMGLAKLTEKTVIKKTVKKKSERGCKDHEQEKK